jgi:hypothetical protein
MRRVYRKHVCTHRDVGVTSVALGVCGGEDGVDKHEGADDLGGDAGALGVAFGELVGAAAVAHVVCALEALDEPDTAYGAQALRDDVEHGADERHLPRQEQAERHSGVDVPTCVVHFRVSMRPNRGGGGTHPC